MFRPQLLAIFRGLESLSACSACVNLCGRYSGLDTVCTVGDCLYCPQSVQENSVEVPRISGQASGGIIFNLL
jgi:hypothetical protein